MSFGVYVHIPFCKAVCPYCDFNVYTGIEHTADAYFDALIQESKSRSHLVNEPATSVFFGGGTPSLVAPSLIGLLLSSLPFSIANGAEITMEANPDGLTLSLLKQFRSAGINRLSLGVQSFVPSVLTALGRSHRAQEAQAAVEHARNAGFDNVSLDLIFGAPNETLQDWERTLRITRALGTEHVSAYGLMIEHATAFGAQVRAGRMKAPDDDVQAEKYERACDTLEHHYEISNWGSKPSTHNLLYWTQGNYLGLGAGAHSHFDGVRSWNHKRPATYMRNATDPVAGSEELNESQRAKEWLQLRLRLVQGLDIQQAEARLGASLATKIDSLVQDGLAEINGTILRLTRRGLLLENEVALRLDAA